MIKRCTYGHSVTVPGNSELTLTASDFGITAIPGYTIFAINRFNTGSVYLYPRQLVATISGNVMTISNTSSSAVTRTVSIGFVFVRNSLIDIVS